jgi:hypothetical protein
MALSRCVWEIRQGGYDDNGGGRAMTAGPPYYIQQDEPELIITDGVTSASGVTTLTSTGGGFTLAMSGSVIRLYEGTYLTDGWYQITSYVDGNTVELDRSPGNDGTGNGVSGATGRVGGAFASLGGFGRMYDDTRDNLFDTQTLFIKYNPTPYYIDVNSYNVPSGGFYMANVDPEVRLSIQGYENTWDDVPENRPKFISNVNTISVIRSAEADDQYGPAVRYLSVCHSGSNNAYAFYGQYLYCMDCDAARFERGFEYVSAVMGCVAHNCQNYGFSNCTQVIKCVSSGNLRGFHGNGAIAVNCLAIDCGNVGFDDFGALFGCAGVGCNPNFRSDSSSDVMAVDCIATDGPGEGYWLSANNIGVYENCYAYNNNPDVDIENSAFRNAHHPEDSGIIILTASPWVDRDADNYALNNVEGGGAVLRNAGTQLPYSGVMEDYMDVGPIQNATEVPTAKLIIS